MITRGLVWRLGASQLVLWGISYYLIAVLGPAIAEETGWSRPLVWGGFSAALVASGIVSPLVGRMIDRHGGRPVMSAGSALMALACLGLAASSALAPYYASWTLLGLAMRMTLYEAAFATLARLGGVSARRAISQITLLGGLASTCLWPVGAALAERFGWRGAVLAYAAFALATVPLHLLIPDGHFATAAAGGPPPPLPRARTRREITVAAALFTTVATLASLLNAAMSAHMIAVLTGLGLAAGPAVWVSTLRGVGQSASRFGEVVFGSGLDPLGLAVLASLLVPLGFMLGAWSGESALAAMGFALLYGAGNGLLTITRGTQPLILFDPASYGSFVGKLTMPGFFVSASAPVAYAALIERVGELAALRLSLAVAVAVFGGSLALWWIFGRPRPLGPG